MAVDRSKLRTGSIIWAIVRDHNGFRKRRPAIVLTPTRDISADEPLTVMAITTTYLDPAPLNCIELPWNHDPRRVATGLARRSAAVLDWLDNIYLDEMDALIGSMPPARMQILLARLREFEERE